MPSSTHEVPTSGLRNPAGAVKGVASATMILQALVLLLALAPLAKLVGLSTPHLLAVLVLILGCFVVVMLVLRTSYGWIGGLVLQVLVLASGVVHWSLSVIGVLFGLLWLYLIRLRRQVSKPAVFDH